MINIRNISLEEKMGIVFGFLAPAPIISLFSITAYVWFLLLISLYIVCFRTLSFKIKQRKNLFLLFFVSSIVSAINCIVAMPREWTDGIIPRVIQFVAVLIIYLYVNEKKGKDLSIGFVKGIYYAAVFQMIWGYLQYFTHLFGIDLNTVVFSDTLHMFSGVASQYRSEWGIKISGLCWNSGNYAPLMIIGFVFSRKKYLRYLFAFVAFLSGSRTLMIGMAFCLLISFIYWLVKVRKVNVLIIVISICVVILCSIIVFLRMDYFVNKLSLVVSWLDVYHNYYTEGSTNTHIMYLQKIPDIIRQNSLFVNLFGFGPNCSGYAYVLHYGFYSTVGRWTVECDYANVLWNYGLLGFGVYYCWFLKGLKNSFRINDKSILLFLTLLLMGFMYNISFDWVVLMYIMLFSLVYRKIDFLSLDYSITNQNAF